MKPAPSSRRKLSLVVPCFNEQAVIETTHQRLRSLLDSLSVLDSEIVYVDDGSLDGTLPLLESIQRGDERVRLLALSRNFGHQIAVSAGLQAAAGDAVVLMDADLQDPPELIPDMVARWREGADVVYGVREARAGETWFKRLSANLFYRLINRLSGTPIPIDTGDFRLMDRRVVDAVLAMPERDRFLRGMVAWAGFRQVPIRYRREARTAGETKYPLRRMLRFAADGLLSFSLVPLRLAVYLGLVASAMALLGICYALVLRLFTDVWVPGWTLLFIAVLFLGGVQLLSLGVIGEYLGRVYWEVKRRPLYLIEERRGFSESLNGGNP
jgi:glycosyltransferase involved in cell wall biosynthesis